MRTYRLIPVHTRADGHVKSIILLRPIVYIVRMCYIVYYNPSTWIMCPQETIGRYWN